MKEPAEPAQPLIGIVGPCTAGKSTLIKRINGQYQVVLRHIAQEHSFVQNMWQRLSQPKWLIFLDVSYQESMQRKKLDWTVEEYQEQQRRLAHALQHADFYLMTDALTPEQVAEQVAAFIRQVGIPPAVE
jgi:ABC-type cobalamin/Fe3+-siderophores transport system ATPase subunit